MKTVHEDRDSAQLVFFFKVNNDIYLITMNLAAEAFSQFKKYSVWLLMSKQKGMFLGKKVLLNSIILI